jgi:hypothetical protein
MDPYREPLLVDPTSPARTGLRGRLARWRAALKRATPETAFRLLVVFLLGNVVATSAGTAVSLELSRRESGKLEKRLSCEVTLARQELRDAKNELSRERAAERSQALLHNATANRPAPPSVPSAPPAPPSTAALGLPGTLDAPMRDMFERAQRRSLFHHLSRMEQRALPARDIARRLQAAGTDVSVEDVKLSEGLRARASLAWQELMSHPQTFLAGFDPFGAYAVRAQDSTVYRVLGLVPGDVLVSVNGQPWDDEQPCSSQCGYLVPDLFERAGSLTLEVLHEGARTVRTFTWEGAPLGRVRSGGRDETAR